MSSASVRSLENLQVHVELGNTRSWRMSRPVLEKARGRHPTICCYQLSVVSQS
jgi:hypothetical protein